MPSDPLIGKGILANQGPHTVCPCRRERGDNIFIGGSFDKVVKTRIPYLSKIRRSGRKSDAQVVDIGIGKIKTTPNRVTGRATSIKNIDRRFLTERKLHAKIYLNHFAIVSKGYLLPFE
jgi:hypothetical protein